MSLIDDFENSFQACLAPITNPISSHVMNNDELKANLDNIQRFLDLSQQIESFFIQKRAILSEQKPEMTLSEEIVDLQHEILRKDELLAHYYEKLSKWSKIVKDASSSRSQMDGSGPSGMKMDTSGGVGPGGPMMPAGMPPPVQMRMPGPGMMSPQTGHMHVPGPMMRPQQGGSGMIPSPVPMGPGVGAQHQVYNPMNTPPTPNQGVLSNPLAYLERTTAHIGMNDNRR